VVHRTRWTEGRSRQFRAENRLKEAPFVVTRAAVFQSGRCSRLNQAWDAGVTGARIFRKRAWLRLNHLKARARE
jgi:hypothetical protein